MRAMARRDLTPHQRGIVKRYYEHRDSIMAHKLGELVSELYTAEGKKADRLWERARAALKNTNAGPQRVEKIIASKDLEALAKLAGELS